MIKFSRNFLKSLLLAVLCTTAASAAAIDFIQVEGAYVRGLPPSVKNTSAYMTIINNSDEEVMLMGAKTNIANSVMMHRTENTKGVMSMEHMMSITIPAKGEFQFVSGAAHLMIMGLKEPIDPADTIEMILLFERGGEFKITMPVRSVLDE